MDYNDTETLIAARLLNTFANFIGFSTMEELLKHSRMVVAPNLGLVGYLADLTHGSFPHTAYRVAFFDSFLEDHLQLFFDKEDAMVWLAQTYSQFSVYQPDTWVDEG